MAIAASAQEIALADRDQHVELARLRARRDLVGEVEQLVGVLAHRRYDADDARARSLGGDEALGDAADLLGVGDRRAAELHHDRADAGRGSAGCDLGDGLEHGLGHGVIVGRPRRAAAS